MEILILNITVTDNTAYLAVPDTSEIIANL